MQESKVLISTYYHCVIVHDQKKIANDQIENETTTIDPTKNK